MEKDDAVFKQKTFFKPIFPCGTFLSNYGTTMSGKAIPLYPKKLIVES